MANVLFIIYPQQSHHNAAFKVGKLLMERQHDVTFAAISIMKSSILANGFRYFEIKDHDDLMPQGVPFKMKNTFFLSIKNLIQGRRFIRDELKRMRQKDFFSKIIDAAKPDLILIDGSFKFYSFQLLKFKIPYIFVETTVPTRKQKNVPPLSTTFVPSNRSWSYIITELLWMLYHNPFRPNSRHAYRVLCKEFNYPETDIDFYRYFQPGFKSIPEINTSLPAFDFPVDAPHKFHEYYVSSLDVFERKEIACDWNYHQSIEKINTYRHVVYCSFGTAAWRYDGHEEFLQRIARAFSTQTDTALVMCVESDNLKRALIRKNFENVFVFRRIPQLQFLKDHADVMITHGGLNTITECILTETPMLVYPGHRLLDQYGNAGRVKFHGIGLKGTYRDSAAMILSKTHALLTDDKFRMNITELKKLSQQNAENGLELIDGLLNEKVYEEVY
jgi:zeaxanthin glucosyltransferase